MAIDEYRLITRLVAGFVALVVFTLLVGIVALLFVMAGSVSIGA